MNIILTGASKGIGKALAVEFAKRKVRSLVLVSRSAEVLQQVSRECKRVNSSSEIISISFDLDNMLLGDPLPLPDGMKIDILINNAGLLVNKPFSSYTTDDVVNMTSTNFLAPICLIKSIYPKMGIHKRGHIVNIGSMGGFQGSAKFPGLSVYSATKAALTCLTECLAVEFQDKNIAVNCLALGAVQTEMLAEAFPEYKAPLNAEEMADYIADFALTGSKYYNGKVLPVSVSTP